ncbi:hypothetical protein Tco_0965676 [Tanacetum coccineum]
MYNKGDTMMEGRRKQGSSKLKLCLDDNSSEHSSCQSNDSEGSCGNTSEHSFETESESISVPNEVSTFRLVVKNEKVVSELQDVEPSCAKHVKTPRQPLKDNETHRKNWNDMMERKLGEENGKRSCGVRRVVNSGNEVAKTVWANAIRINHSNNFVPKHQYNNCGIITVDMKVYGHINLKIYIPIREWKLVRGLHPRFKNDHTWVFKIVNYTIIIHSSSTIYIITSSTIPLTYHSHTNHPIPLHLLPPIPTPTPSPIPETEPAPFEHIYEEPSPVHQHFSPSQEQAQGQLPMNDLLQVVPQLISRIDSLETNLKQTKLTMGGSCEFSSESEEVEGFLKRRNRNWLLLLQQNPLIREGDQEEKGLRENSCLSLDFQEEFDVVHEQVITDEGVSTGSTILSTGVKSEELSFEEVKKEFDKLVKQVESFAPINFEATKASLKRFGEELQTKTSKRLKSVDSKDIESTKEVEKKKTDGQERIAYRH